MRCESSDETSGVLQKCGTPASIMSTQIQRASGAATTPDDDQCPWRRRLRASLFMKADPIFVFPERIIPGASVWRGARLWTLAFRAAGLQRGDRVILALEPSPAFLMVLVAALWDGLTLVLASPEAANRSEELLDEMDARLMVGGSGQHCVVPDADSGPPEVIDGLRTCRGERTPDVCMMLRTSGTTGAGKWMALSTRNIMSVLECHIPLLGFGEAIPVDADAEVEEASGGNGAVMLSLLPWHHAFGLIINLLPAMFGGAMIVREASNGRDAGSILRAAETYRPTHMSMVPLQAERLAELPEGRELLASLTGGIVGGAQVRPDLAALLAETNLRAGYGQTEAGPGISLGEPGVWCGGYLGQVLGCRTRVNSDGVLEVRGPNVCIGHWTKGRLQRLDPDRWLNTGDVVRAATVGGPDGLVFLGRADSNIKLSNGRLVEVGLIEDAIMRAVPGVREAWIASPDGHTLMVGVVVAAGAEMPERGVVAACLGPLADRFGGLVRLDQRTLPLTGKGAVDRSRLGAVMPAATAA